MPRPTVLGGLPGFFAASTTRLPPTGNPDGYGYAADTTQSGAQSVDYAASSANAYVCAAEMKPKLEQTAREHKAIIDTYQQNGLEIFNINEWQQKASLGDGHFGSVSLYKRAEGEFLAVKEVTRAREAVGIKESLMEQISKELNAITQISGHENLMKIEGLMTRSFNGEPAVVGIAMEYCELGDLSTYLLQNREAISDAKIIKMALDIAKGLAYMHANNTIHRDLKPANILINSKHVAKISDFGTTRKINPGIGALKDTLVTDAGAADCTAPEILVTGGSSTKAADIFSFGLLMWYLAQRGKEMPYGTQNREIIGGLLKGKYRPVQGCPILGKNTFH